MNRKHNTGINIGGSSILMIFVLLCLTTFATLSMVSANADYKLTQQTALSTAQYYDADARAEVMLGQIDGYLKSCADLSRSAAEYNRLVVEGISRFTGAQAWAEETGVAIQYEMQVNDTQSLSVQLTTGYGAPERYALMQWQVVNTAPLAELEDGGLNLYIE